MSETKLRQRAAAAIIKSQDELIEAVKEAASLQMEHDEIMLLVERKLRAVKDDYIVKAEELKRRVNDGVSRIHKYAVAHRVELFQGKQGIKVAGHDLEFRKSPGKTEALKGFKITDIVDGLLALEDEELSERLTTVKAALDKDNILKAWEESEDTRNLLRSLGLEVVKDESFKFTPSSQSKIGGAIVGEREGSDA